MANPYAPAGCEPNLIRSFVCFTDVLGWQARIRECICEGRATELLRDAKEAMSAAHGRVRERASSGVIGLQDFYLKTFTDNVVLGYPIRSNNWASAEPECGQLLYLLADLQFEMATRGFFLRGAVAIGDHYMDDDFVFGDALLEAAGATNSSGTPPRIVMTESMQEPFRGIATNYGAESIENTPMKRILLRDDDGSLFVDYIKMPFIAFPDGPIFDDQLDAHRRQIKQGLERHEAGSAVRAKYEWLATYHNSVCNRWLPDELGPEEVVDDGEEILQRQEREKVALCKIAIEAL